MKLPKSASGIVLGLIFAVQVSSCRAAANATDARLAGYRFAVVEQAVEPAGGGQLRGEVAAGLATAGFQVIDASDANASPAANAAVLCYARLKPGAVSTRVDLSLRDAHTGDVVGEVSDQSGTRARALAQVFERLRRARGEYSAREEQLRHERAR